MHIILAIISIIAVWTRKDYVKWETYYPTMLFIATGNLTYNFLCASHWLWRLSPDVTWFNHSLLEISYTFIVFPGTALMFLARYPKGQGMWRITRHYLFWIGLYVGVEAILAASGSILYDYGWSLWWSALFDTIMFPVLVLHHKKPLVALLLGFLVAILLLWYFDIPVNIPIEKR
ncbi:CBO0543 family protein [Aquibacillus salsiterrae]|uniref:Uncharacterized protein n=1 Tax=Aquibacillus salsiterrae TaxID=2950439 RepID=A0A9X4AF15_9BACI|nr:CBO0543 family protein [Aquibacillus salsiterrae]MDC3417401.1 hypothetical protein [Aquibacillus salsiterrae]